MQILSTSKGSIVIVIAYVLSLFVICLFACCCIDIFVVAVKGCIGILS